MAEKPVVENWESRSQRGMTTGDVYAASGAFDHLSEKDMDEILALDPYKFSNPVDVASEQAAIRKYRSAVALRETPARGKNGRFLKGNPGGPGQAKKLARAQLESEYIKRLSPEKIGVLLDDLYDTVMESDDPYAKLAVAKFAHKVMAEEQDGKGNTYNTTIMQVINEMQGSKDEDAEITIDL